MKKQAFIDAIEKMDCEEILVLDLNQHMFHVSDDEDDPDNSVGFHSEFSFDTTTDKCGKKGGFILIRNDDYTTSGDINHESHIGDLIYRLQATAARHDYLYKKIAACYESEDDDGNEIESEFEQENGREADLGDIGEIAARHFNFI